MSGCSRAVCIVILAGFSTIVFADSEQKAKPASEKTGSFDTKNPAAAELLDKYAETQDKLKSFIAKASFSNKGYCNHSIGSEKPCWGDYSGRYEVRFDGWRASLRSSNWGYINPWLYYPQDDPSYESELWDGETGFGYVYHSKSGPGYSPLKIGKDPNRQAGRKLLLNRYFGGIPMGYFRGDKKRIDVKLREADTIRVQDKMEKAEGRACYVIEARIKEGEYKLWIDPEHGHNIVKIEIERDDMAHLEHFSESMKCARFKKVDDVWLPMEWDTRRYWDWPGDHYCEGTMSIKLEEIILNPDHNSLGSFVPDDIRDGARTTFPFPFGHQVTKGSPLYVWSKDPNFVVDEKGRVTRYDPNASPIKVTKTLPDLNHFDLKLDPDWAKDKMVLLYCWEIGEPNSEQWARSLIRRQESLAEKGVAVIFVEACGATRAKLKLWAQKNKVGFPVGSFRERDVKPLRQNWVIEKLPWLVLTDKEHVVIAEGFALSQLDDKIKQGSGS
ncbi:MAG: hypothetical protein ACYSTF_08085 [Planctomycetota bacterium]|jgi:hypothetical protein